MSMTNATVMIDVCDVAVKIHCEHSDGHVSAVIEHDRDAITVYLHGSIEDLSLFAQNLASTVAEWAVHQVEVATR